MTAFAGFVVALTAFAGLDVILTLFPGLGETATYGLRIPFPLFDDFVDVQYDGLIVVCFGYEVGLSVGMKVGEPVEGAIVDVGNMVVGKKVVGGIDVNCNVVGVKVNCVGVGEPVAVLKLDVGNKVVGRKVDG